MDFLGLRNLSILGEAIAQIKITMDTTIDLTNLPIDDKEVYALLSSGETTGVFQLESGGMRRVARALRPNTFSDITAMVALYRPGPMDLIDDFIEGKLNPSKVHYLHPDLEPVFKETYVIMVYQEQALQVANVLAGYSLGEADILRRAIGKKKKEIMDEQHAEFVDRSINKGYTKETAEKVWSYIEKFSGYGFNKAHAASYAMIAYQTAYMKVKYPVEYMTALLTVESVARSANSDEKILRGVQECKRMNIVILPPEINKSLVGFSIEPQETSLNKKAIRFGLTAIKNVGTAAIQAIMEARQKKPFESFTDFLIRVDSRKVNKKVLECLIKSGCFDSYANRATLLTVLEEVRQKISSSTSDSEEGGLFTSVQTTASSVTDTFAAYPEYPQAELLSFEKELFGFYLTDHPMANALKEAAKLGTKTIDELDTTVHKGTIVWLGGIISQMRVVQTKKTERDMCFGTLDDGTGRMEFVVFPKTYEQVKSQIVTDAVVLLKGKLEEREDTLSLIVDAVKTPEIEEDLTLQNNPSAQTIEIPRGTPSETLQKLGTLLKANKGNTPIILVIPNGGEPKRMKLPYGVEWKKPLEESIAKLLGSA
jgi:DNA polymerase-3 subunit alpha